MGQDTGIRANTRETEGAIEGRSEIENARSELLRLAARLIIEEALEGLCQLRLPGAELEKAEACRGQDPVASG